MEFRLQGERLTLKTDGATLADVLKQFCHAGVWVRVDPEVRGVVRADVENGDLQESLDQLLEPFGYVLIWDVIRGPIGPIPRLSEIQVFKPGRKGNVVPLPGVENNFTTASAPDGQGAKFVKDEILVGFKPGTRRDEFEILISQIGGTVIGSVPGVGVYLVRLPPGSNVLDLIEQLKRNAIVAAVEPNWITEAEEPARTAALPEAESEVMAPVLREGASPVAVLDSGLMSVAGLSNAVLGTFNAVNPETAPDDTVGHGTQMAMIAAGAISPDGMAAGAGDGVPVLAIRAFDDNGMASNFSLMRSIAYALQNGARVINMSWGSSQSSDFLRAAVEYAQSKGAVLVASAGNEPTGQAMYPAAYPGVVAISALDSNGQLWENSNTGEFVSFSAPGTAEFPVGYQGPPGSYAGTSIAGAYVSRALALYFAQHPGASAQQALEALQESAIDAGADGKDNAYGYGILNDTSIGRLLR